MCFVKRLTAAFELFSFRLHFAWPVFMLLFLFSVCRLQSKRTITIWGFMLWKRLYNGWFVATIANGKWWNPSTPKVNMNSSIFFFIQFIICFGWTVFFSVLPSAISRAPFLSLFFFSRSVFPFLFVFVLFCILLLVIVCLLFVRDHDTISIDCVQNFALFFVFYTKKI